MKKTILFVFSIILSQQVFTQVITTLPEFPTANDEITIRFDATKGDAGLQGYNGKVYAHTGVTINGNRWQNVIGNWGDDNAQPEFTRTGQDQYQLFIGKPHEFYNVDPGIEITELSFVFRSEGSEGPTGRGPDGADIFVPLFEPGLTIVINAPEINTNFGDPSRAPFFASKDEISTFEFSAAAIGTQIAAFTLYENNSQVAQSNTDQLTYDFDPSQKSTGLYSYIVIGEDTEGLSDTANFTVVLNPEPNSAPPPPGTRAGININSPDVTLSLFAPGKDFVYVIGDFNDWKILPEYQMNKYESADTTLFWITLSNLNTTTEHAFQYLIDGNIRVADSYTKLVLDPANDQYIPNSVFPNLKAYPDGKTVEPASVFRINEQEYNWQVTDFEKPAVEDLVIYEMWLLNFLEDHSYETLIDTLSYLERLGVNAIELMPVNEFEGNESWGYNPSFFLALDKYYGTPESFKRFVDECHKRGIAVIIDMVYNHAYNQNPMARMYWNGGRPAQDSPWFNVTAPHTDFAWGNDFNHESIHTQYFIDRVNEFWLTEYKIDGFRFDFTRGFTNKSGSSGPYDQARIDLIKRMADQIWAVDPNAYVILEHLVDSNSEMKALADYGMLLWGNMNHNYNEATMGWNSGNNSNLSGVSYKSRGWNNPHLIGYMESHDEERLMYKNIQFGNSTNPAHDAKDISVALDRAGLAAAFFFTIPGPKMIWQFGELGFDYSINYPCGTDQCRLSLKPFIWDTYYSNTERQDLYKTYKSLIGLKKNYDVFRTTDFTLSVNGPVKRINLNHWSMNVTIVGNFDVVENSISPNFQTTGTWYDYFSGDSISVSDVSANINMKPGQFNIFTSKKLPQPDIIISSVEDEIAGTVDEYFLGQNYPNPFNPATTINYSIKQAGEVALHVYDVLGRQVTKLVDKFQNIGSYSVNFDASNLSSGIYFYTLNSGSFTATKKLMLIKEIGIPGQHRPGSIDMKKYFIEYLQYNDWANEQVIASLKGIESPPESCVHLVSHIIAAQDIWLERIVGNYNWNIELWETYSLIECSLLSLQSTRKWMNFIRQCKSSDFENLIKYKNTKGNSYETPVREIISHVLNHSSYHRGQTNQLLIEKGLAPAITDYIFYTRI